MAELPAGLSGSPAKVTPIGSVRPLRLGVKETGGH